jgi:phenylalanyl-tRNA synthetase alpha chain
MTNLVEIASEIQSFIINDSKQAEDFRIKFIGSKGLIKDLYAELKNIDADQKREFGQQINQLKNQAEEKYNLAKENLSDSQVEKDYFDLTKPGFDESIGSRHPLSIVRSGIIEIFKKIGYAVSEGPEIEDDWHNFSALNFPPEHPARDMQDTFFIEKGEQEIALRTHTSSVQVRVMENSTPPIRTISPGRVYRNEAISARAHCFFHQVE